MVASSQASMMGWLRRLCDGDLCSRFQRMFQHCTCCPSATSSKSLGGYLLDKVPGFLTHSRFLRELQVHTHNPPVGLQHTTKHFVMLQFPDIQVLWSTIRRGSQQQEHSIQPLHDHWTVECCCITVHSTPACSWLCHTGQH